MTKLQFHISGPHKTPDGWDFCYLTPILKSGAGAPFHQIIHFDPEAPLEARGEMLVEAKTSMVNYLRKIREELNTFDLDQ